MTLIERALSWAVDQHPMVQLCGLLAIGWAWVFVSAWMRAGDSLRGSAERRAIR